MPAAAEGSERAGPFVGMLPPLLRVALTLRARSTDRRSSYPLPVAVASSALLMAIPLVLSPLQDLLSVVELDPAEGLVVALAAALPGLAVTVLRRVFRWQ